MDQSIPARAGLCHGCAHAHRIANDRGSVFVLCGRSRSDARFPRYPALPVLTCPGFEPIATVQPEAGSRPA